MKKFQAGRLVNQGSYRSFQPHPIIRGWHSDEETPTGATATSLLEHALRDENDFARHVDYIHFNPVKHGFVSSAIEWPYSSFRRHVEEGVYSPDWGQGGIDFEGVGHE